MQDILSYSVTSIVEKTDKVEITEVQENGILNLNIKVDPSEMGKIIGKNGKVIKAIRNVMKIPAMKDDKRIYITLSENPQN